MYQLDTIERLVSRNYSTVMNDEKERVLAMNLVKEIEKQLPEMLGVLQNLVELESPSNEKAAIDKLVDYLDEQARARGMQTERFNQPIQGDHLRVSFGPDDAAEKLLILCHIDTVWPLGTLETIPFSNVEGILRGPGVFDMKLGGAQALFALQKVMERGLLGDKQVSILYTSDEEIGSRTSRPLIEEFAKDCKCVMVLEPSVPPLGSLKTFRKGVGGFKIEITGKASHAGANPELGISAVTELAHQILYIQGLANKELGTTVSVNVVTAGTKSNVIPAKAYASVDLRVKTLEEGDRITRDVLESKPFTNAEVKITGGVSRPPMIRSETAVAMFKHAQGLASELGFDLTEASTGGGSDGNFTAAIGIPTIDGLGAVGAGGHAVTEHAFVKDIPYRTALLVRLLETL